MARIGTFQNFREGVSLRLYELGGARQEGRLLVGVRTLVARSAFGISP